MTKMFVGLYGLPRRLNSRGYCFACLDGLVGAKGLLHDLKSGATAVMCPALDAARWPVAQICPVNNPGRGCLIEMPVQQGVTPSSD